MAALMESLIGSFIAADATAQGNSLHWSNIPVLLGSLLYFGVRIAMSPIVNLTLEDELVVVVAPDPPGADECLRMIRQVKAVDFGFAIVSNGAQFHNMKLLNVMFLIKFGMQPLFGFLSACFWHVLARLWATSTSLSLPSPNATATISNKEQEEGLPEKPIVLFNQRLASGDVGLGLNVRRMRNFVLKDFAITYSLRPIGFGEIGTVYRRYPGMWQETQIVELEALTARQGLGQFKQQGRRQHQQYLEYIPLCISVLQKKPLSLSDGVFLQDPELPGRYRLVAEKPSRPEGEYLDYLVQQAMGTMEEEGKEGQQGGAGGIFGQLQRTVNSLNYFMKSLSK
eukprot:1137096-Pelagomonas_calceolata.AAC.2